MKAMILSAGEGTRLRPLTDICPKVLVPVVNRPVIARIAEYLIGHGVEEIIVNTHFHYQKIINYLKKGDPPGVRIEHRVEKEILGTGGGLKNTQDFWGANPFIVINGDILTDIDLKQVHKDHLEKSNLATMVLHDVPMYNKIKIDSEMNVLSIGPGTHIEGSLAFTGIHIINPEVLDFIPENKNYDIIQCYKELIDRGKPIRGYVATGHKWVDIGTIPDYMMANVRLLPPDKIAIADGCTIHPDASVEEWAVIGKRTSIARDALVKRSIIWSDAVLEEGVRVVDSIVTTDVVVKEDLFGGVALSK